MRSKRLGGVSSRLPVFILLVLLGIVGRKVFSSVEIPAEANVREVRARSLPTFAWLLTGREGLGVHKGVGKGVGRGVTDGVGR